MARPRPSRFSINRATSFLAALYSILSPITAAADATCYDRSGTSRPGWKACNPTASGGSTCCDQNDFCMSNGLCLNAGGNQAYTQQGCTRSDWAAPCVFYCPPGNPSDGLYYMEYCWRGFDAPKDHWCCGVGCCDNGTAISIPIASEIYKPGSLTGASSATSSSTPSVSQPVGVDGRGDGNGGSGVSMGLVLGIALGLGIPLLLIAAAFVWLFVRNKKAKNTKVPVAGAQTQSSAAEQHQGWYVPPSRYAQWSQDQRQTRQQQQQQRQEQWSPPSELDVRKDPAELDVRNEKAWR